MLRRQADFYDLTDHLRHLLRGDANNRVREIFFDHFYDAGLKPSQRIFLSHYLSSSAKDYTYGHAQEFWRLLVDYARKRPAMLGTLTPDRMIRDSIDLALFTRWNIQNFRQIFAGIGNRDPNLPIPPLGTDDESFDHPFQFLDYLEQRFLPALQQAIERHTGLSPEHQEKLIAEHETLYAENVDGVEIMRPFPAQPWQSTFSPRPGLVFAG